MKKIGAALPALAWDAAGVVGVVLLSIGAGMAYRPAGFIVAGALLLAGSILSARAG